ncbi:MAG: DinB family protein [Actinomycetota bacterium]|nr:DinB family protein [Actinomycetota bacterium]
MLDRQSKPLTVRFLFLQCLREYAQHTGHADILRELLLAA